MACKEAARGCGNSPRANVHHADVDSLARNYEETVHIAGIIIGLCFGLMLFVGILAG